MKKYLIFAASVLLFMSCNKSDMKVYEGNYSVDSKTVITVNNRNVDISDFENASISISITDGDLCEVTLTNFIRPARGISPCNHIQRDQGCRRSIILRKHKLRRPHHLCPGYHSRRHNSIHQHRRGDYSRRDRREMEPGRCHGIILTSRSGSPRP